MDDVVVKRFDELDSYQGQGQFLYAGKSLGVTAWGLNILKLPANWPDYPLHDHAAEEQEEVYVVLRGHARLEVDGQTWSLEPHMVVRVGPNRKRKIVPGPDGVTLLAIGGTPGKPYTPSWGRRK
jgi:mannose-6-phosphate isomerase-like protein (cupin superfamily)